MGDIGWQLIAMRLTAMARQAAEDVLSLADDAGMPDSYKETDSRLIRSREVLAELPKDPR